MMHATWFFDFDNANPFQSLTQSEWNVQSINKHMVAQHKTILV